MNSIIIFLKCLSELRFGCNLKEDLCRLYEKQFFSVRFCYDSENSEFLHLKTSFLPCAILIIQNE